MTSDTTSSDELILDLTGRECRATLLILAHTHIPKREPPGAGAARGRVSEPALGDGPMAAAVVTAARDGQVGRKELPLPRLGLPHFLRGLEYRRNLFAPRGQLLDELDRCLVDTSALSCGLQRFRRRSGLGSVPACVVSSHKPPRGSCGTLFRPSSQTGRAACPTGAARRRNFFIAGSALPPAVVQASASRLTRDERSPPALGDDQGMRLPRHLATPGQSSQTRRAEPPPGTQGQRGAW